MRTEHACMHAALVYCHNLPNMHACRRLDCLTRLTLTRTEVKLDVLLPISRKVVQLDLSHSLLHAGRLTAYATNVFNAHWPVLTMLSLDGANLDAVVGTVDLPVVKELNMEGFCEVDNTPVEPSILGIGCPNCSQVALHLHQNATPDEDGLCDCLDFLNLSSVLVYVDTTKLCSTLHEKRFPPELPGLLLPESVCRITLSPDSCSCGEKLDMAAVLELTRECIAAGVQLEELWALGCDSRGGAIESPEADAAAGGDEQACCMRWPEPSTRQYEQYYEQICEGLHGLEILDLSKSPAISQRAIDCMVAALPDLVELHIALVLSWSLEDTWGFARMQRMVCSGLEELKVSLLAQKNGDKRRALRLMLMDAACLDRCVVRVCRAPVAGDSISIEMECSGTFQTTVHAHAKYVQDTFCTLGGKVWELSVELGHREEGVRHAQVTWIYGTRQVPRGWHMHVIS